MFVQKSHFESEPTKESIAMFHFNTTQRKITIGRSLFKDSNFTIFIINVVVEIRIHGVRFENRPGYFEINIGNRTSTVCNTFTLAHVVVENSTVLSYSLAGIYIYCHRSTSLGLIYVINTDFQGRAVKSSQTGGYIGFHFVSCTFSDIFSEGIHLPEVVQVNITNCHFRLRDDPECREGCSVNVFGYGHIYKSEPQNFELVRSLFFPTCTSGKWQGCLTLHIENSVFVGSAGDTGGAIKCVEMSLLLHNCEFTMTEKSKPAATGGFLYYKDTWDRQKIIITNVTFNSSNLQISTSVSILATYGNRIDFLNIFIMCPQSMGVDHYQGHYFCDLHCKSDQYTHEAGNAVLQGDKAGNLSIDANLPNCSSCPVGANCDKHIEALPNYWGYKDQADKVNMIRCPNGYCCQDNETCKGIDSCNKHRTGPLCGKCEGNCTESLFSPECLMIEYCPAAEIIILYIVCVVAYGLGLMAFNYVKDVGPSVIKKVLEALKRRCTHRKRKQQSPVDTYELEYFQAENVFGSLDKIPNVWHRLQKCGQESVLDKVEKGSSVDVGEKVDKDDDAIKYVQILFYYVQDAALFKVHLQGDGQQDRSIVVKILQFSPDVLTTLYTPVSDLCFSPETTAVTKILFYSLFGPCVMIFIFLLYLGQKYICHITGKSWKMFRSRLVQTFLLVVLFSYQKLVIGAFTLVQCVDIGNSTVLYVQGDIDCYTWWHYAIEVYSCLSIIPLLFVLSHAPFYVADREMSVRMFLFGCLFPVPVMVVYQVQRQLRMRNMKSLQSVAEMQSDTSSLSEHTVVSEQNCIERHVASDIDWNVQVDEFFLRMDTDNDTRSDISRDTLGQVFVNSDSDTDIGSEYSTDLIRIKHEKPNVSDETISHMVDTQKRRVPDGGKKETQSKSKFNDSREAITCTLLKHYRCLNVFRVRFTWLGVHKLYRVGLVACNTYITDPLKKLFIMSIVLAVLSVTNTFTKPYKDRNTNRVSIMSYMANICIAVINLWKTALVTFGCQINCASYRNIVLGYLGKVENVLLIYIPVVLVPVAFVYVAVQKYRGNSKEE